MTLYQVTFLLDGELTTLVVSAKNITDAHEIMKLYHKKEIKICYTQSVETAKYQEISVEFVASFYDKYRVQKVIQRGDKIFLLSVENEVIEYTVNDIAVGYPACSTDWSIGFYVSSKYEADHFIPYDVIRELIRNGLMWRENDACFATTIREIRKRQ